MFRRWGPDELEWLVDHINHENEEQQERERKDRVVSDLEQRLAKMKGRP